MPLRWSDSGSNKTEAWLKRLRDSDIFSTLDHFGAMGAAALSAATPVESGKTAAAWSYRINRKRGFYSIEWTNTNIVDGKPLAVLLQIGHGTGTGGYVQGRDYINPAIQPVFDQIEAEIRKVVST